MNNLTDEQLEALARNTQERLHNWQIENHLEHFPETKVGVDYVNRKLVYTKEEL